MVKERRVKDLVVLLNEYPHMPYWGTLREAIVQLNVAYGSGHNTVLVFDEAYRLAGVLSESDILKGLESDLGRHFEEGLPLSWDDLLKAGSEKQLARPIEEVMSKVGATINAEDSILKASHIMLQEKTNLLAVLDEGKVIGVVRMGELFHEITNTVLKL